MHPTIIKALADELIAERTTIRPLMERERRPRRRLKLVWAMR